MDLNKKNNNSAFVMHDKNHKKGKYESIATRDTTNFPKECNYGTPMGKFTGTFAVEVEYDRDQLQYGDLSEKILQQKYGAFPPTIIIKADGISRAYLFKYPRNLTITSAAHKLGFDINICADDGFILCPPSVIGNSVFEYEDNGAELAFPPMWLIDLITVKG